MNPLRKARTDAGLTLQQLSEKSGVAVETLSRLENDEHKPQARTLKKIEDVLGIPTAELLQGLGREEVLVGSYGGDGIFHGERINFRGEKIKTLDLDGGDLKTTLYKGPNGYRVHVEDIPDLDLYPNRKDPDTGETEYLTYATAEDLAKDYRELASLVGVFPVRYID